MLLVSTSWIDWEARVLMTYRYPANIVNGAAKRPQRNAGSYHKGRVMEIFLFLFAESSFSIKAPYTKLNSNNTCDLA